jgi:xylitol oxidase
MPDPKAVTQAVSVIEEALAPYQPLPHWGKVFTPADIGSRYAMLPHFAALRDRLDPTGKFANRWLDTVLPRARS